MPKPHPLIAAHNILALCNDVGECKEKTTHFRASAPLVARAYLKLHAHTLGAIADMRRRAGNYKTEELRRPEILAGDTIAVQDLITALGATIHGEEEAEAHGGIPKAADSGGG